MMSQLNFLQLKQKTFGQITVKQENTKLKLASLSYPRSSSVVKEILKRRGGGHNFHTLFFQAYFFSEEEI